MTKKISATKLCRILQGGDKAKIKEARTLSIGDTIEQQKIAIPNNTPYTTKGKIILAGIIIGIILICVKFLKLLR